VLEKNSVSIYYIGLHWKRKSGRNKKNRVPPTIYYTGLSIQITMVYWVPRVIPAAEFCSDIIQVSQLQRNT